MTLKLISVFTGLMLGYLAEMILGVIVRILQPRLKVSHKESI